MQLDDNKFSVEPGDTVLIKDGVFHKVYNPSDEEELYFICVLRGARHK
jgi:mannose-6-phosphate isomerase-like protein (cupin superfamily)